MRDYLKPLRRQIGMITLVMACVFAAGWIRSCLVCDRIDFGFRNHFQSVTSLDEQLYWWRWRRELKSGYQLGRPLQTSRFLTETDRQQNEAKWELHPVTTRDDSGLRRLPKGHMFTETVIPYWSIVIPLTLLSAWLLLSKPREKKPQPP